MDNTQNPQAAPNRGSEDRRHIPPPPQRQSSNDSSSETIAKLQRDLQESEVKAKLWREQADEERLKLVQSLTDAGILKRDLQAASERLRQLEAQANRGPASSSSSQRRGSLNEEQATSRIDQRILESLRDRELELVDEVKALRDELTTVKQELWDADQSADEATLLRQELESTRERLRQLEGTQDGLGTNPWSSEGIREVRRNSIDTTISSISGSRAHLLAQEEELRATRRELLAVKQQLSDAVTLAGSQSPRRTELVEGSQTFMMPADTSSVVDVIQKVNAVNEVISQTAAYLGEVLFYEVLAPGGDRQERRQRAINASYEGSRNLLGEKLTNALAQASVKEPGEEINSILVQIVMQIALTNWCGIFGRRWTSFQKAEREPIPSGGPRRDESAASAGVSRQADYDRFVSELYDTIREHEDQDVAGRWRAITRAHVPFSTNGWDRSLMTGICSIMLISGWVTRSDAEIAQIERRLASIFKPLLDLRKATGEDITSADLDIALVRLGEAFNPSYMEDAYPGERSQGKPKGKNGASDLVAGTTGLGLQRLAVRRLKSGVVLRQAERFLSLPKVVLEKTIMEALDSSPRARKEKKRTMSRDSMGPGPKGSGVFGLMFGL
ncbi:hypothetical protein EST38_g11223 [Candolleomyces aberdarensis]|uniref:Uncharacterized protein n=1 Tax=Candolleomyces aberdarensis TaxID=2316362 RepID=A0A4Q2D861_9AGAR|nr:hypothetical protein EST38_g11223 [Candolleomyces aberdarensis]